MNMFWTKSYSYSILTCAIQASGHRLGYETIHVMRPQELEMEGTKYFAALPPDFVVELVVKYLWAQNTAIAQFQAKQP